MISIKSKVKNWKKLKEYTNEELYEFLDNNSDEDAIVLAVICSEILRRQIRQPNEEVFSSLYD